MRRQSGTLRIAHLRPMDVATERLNTCEETDRGKSLRVRAKWVRPWLAAAWASVLGWGAVMLGAQGVAAQVSLVSWDSRSFQVQMGEFRVWYDSSSTFGALLIARGEGASLGLANVLCGGSTLEPLQPDASPQVQAQESEGEVRVVIRSSRSWGEMVSEVEIDKRTVGLLHWVVRVRPATDFSPWKQRRPMFFCDLASGSQVSGTLEVYARQAPWAAGIAYFGEKRILNSSVLLFVNFTSLNPYFELVHGAPNDAVYLSSSQLGFVRPVNAQIFLPRGQWTVLEDSYLVLEPGLPGSPSELGLRFLRGLSSILSTIERPWSSLQIDWLPIALRTLEDLQNPVCWVDLGGWRYLRAYVDVPRYSSAEAIAQLDVLCPLAALERARGNWELWTFDDLYLIPGLVTFLQPTYRVFVNDTPPYGVTGSNGWYQLQLLIDLAELARGGGPASGVAKTLLQESLPTIVQLARRNGYRFYEGFRYADYQVSGALEPDATGGYAYLMLDAFRIFGDSLYLGEACNALDALPLDKGFDFVYEAHFSAMTAAACARMAALTGDTHYLELVYLPLAALFRIVWWWECDYGYGHAYQTFGGLSPMIYAGVITPKEQYESWWYLREFLDSLPRGAEFRPEVLSLVSLFLEETPRVCYYCLPPHLPREAVWDRPSVYNSINHPELMIPVEDLRQGWEKSGQVGQEIYGAGMALAFAAAQAQSGVQGLAPRTVPVELGLEVWPNPASSAAQVRLHSPTCDWGEIRILDARGREVRSAIRVPTNKPVRLSSLTNAPGLPSGVYVIVGEAGGVRTYRKVLVLR
ncbi:MAG: T9SS type A sorting domain-containing protein [candidate division KSB1 bacterium]|nr:T9SS type A sorting domain-containing protein [candidate division KSB1 bacterium]